MHSILHNISEYFEYNDQQYIIFSSLSVHHHHQIDFRKFVMSWHDAELYFSFFSFSFWTESRWIVRVAATVRRCLLALRPLGRYRFRKFRQNRGETGEGRLQPQGRIRISYLSSWIWQDCAFACPGVWTSHCRLHKCVVQRLVVASWNSRRKLPPVVDSEKYELWWWKGDTLSLGLQF